MNDELRDAARAVIDTADDYYTTRNGRRMSIEGSDGEKCWIVPFDQFEALRRAVTAIPSALSGDAGEEALRQSLAEAYRKGATDVHNYWVNNPGEPPRGDPEFGEAASDYAAAALDLFDSSARFIPSHQGAGE